MEDNLAEKNKLADLFSPSYKKHAAAESGSGNREIRDKVVVGGGGGGQYG